MLLILIVTLLYPSVSLLTIIFGAVGWAYTASFVRARVRGWNAGKVDDDHEGGYRRWREIAITVSHLLAANTMAFLLLEGALSFLGMGIYPPVPSWGNMLSQAIRHLNLGSHLLNAPGILLLLTAFCLSLIAERLRESLVEVDAKEKMVDL